LRKQFFYLVILCTLGAGALASGPAQAQHPTQKEPSMAHHAAGSFDVKTTPIAANDATEATSIGRYALVKQYHGDLDATAKGEMLGAGDPSSGSAGYVAIEQVTGTLAGRTGSFALQHSGVMDSSGLKLSVSVVPGSGTGQLKGLGGTLVITNASGHHTYQLDYSLPAD
jgi:hypothetical protein